MLHSTATLSRLHKRKLQYANKFYAKAIASEVTQICVNRK